MPPTLNLFRELALGKSEPYVELSRLFDRQTEQGSAMQSYDRLLGSAVEAIAGTFQKRLATGLQASRAFVLPEMADQVLPTSEFELVTWLVVLAP